MAEVLRSYSSRLRELLDEAVAAPDRVQSRIAAGITAAEAGGGLPALVAAL